MSKFDTTKLTIACLTLVCLPIVARAMLPITSGPVYDHQQVVKSAQEAARTLKQYESDKQKAENSK